MAKQTISTTKALRQENRNRIFKFLYKSEDACTKQDISAALKMSLPTVTQNITELMEMGLIKYGGSAESTGGRKPRLIEISENSRYAVGVSITKRHLRFVAVNLKAKQLGLRKTEFKFEDCDDISGFIASELAAFLKEAKLNEKRLLGVRVTVPGIVNVNLGIVEFAPTLQASPITVDKILQKIPYPCSIENDANAGGFAELYNAKETAGVVYISLDRGVGGSVFLNGRPYPGNNNRSGEFGHICIHKNGITCSCGRKGCLEAYCSADRLSFALGISLEQFFEKLQKNEEYKRIWLEYLADLTLGLQTLQIILDCKIILGGSLAPYLAPYLPALQDGLNIDEKAFAEKNSVSLSRFGADSNCVGAALHYISSFIENV